MNYLKQVEKEYYDRCNYISFWFIICLYFRTYAIPLLSKTNKPNLEHNEQMGINNQTVEILFFYADWCPHCKKAKPHWNNLKNSEKVGEECVSITILLFILR